MNEDMEKSPAEGEQPKQEAEIKLKHIAGVVLAVAAMTGLQIAAIKHGETPKRHHRQPNPDVVRHYIDRDKPARVIQARVIPGDGSRIVLGQCMDGSLPSAKKPIQDQPGCFSEQFESRFPDPGLTYEPGQKFDFDDVMPPMQSPAPGR